MDKPAWFFDAITDRQRGTIEMIEANTRHVFKGKTKGEAWEFIGQYIDESRAASRETWRRVNEEEAQHRCIDPDYDDVLSEIYMWGND